jgi:hypothetical protein
MAVDLDRAVGGPFIWASRRSSTGTTSSIVVFLSDLKIEYRAAVRAEHRPSCASELDEHEDPPRREGSNGSDDGRFVEVVLFAFNCCIAV